MEKIKWRGGTLLAPVPPALVTCADGECKNVLTVAWTGIINSDPPKTYISVRPSRFSHAIIKNSGVFAINLTTKALVRAADWCGVCTGAKNDKFAKCNLVTEPAKEIDCPILSESPITLECRVTDVVSLGSHDMFLADIVAVDVRCDLVDESGKLHLEKAELVAYSHGDYYELVKRLGHFGFSVAKKKKKPRSPKKS